MKTEVNNSLEKYQESIEWMKNNISKDEIYDFAQQAIMSAEYFMHRLAEHFDVMAEMQKDAFFAHWVKSTLSIRLMKEGHLIGK